MPTLSLKPKGEQPEAPKLNPVQAPPAAHGAFSLNGIPVFAPQVDLNQTINPATGLPYVQVMDRPKGGMISPPPSKNFR